MQSSLIASPSIDESSSEIGGEWRGEMESIEPATFAVLRRVLGYLYKGHQVRGGSKMNLQPLKTSVWSILLLVI